MLYEIRSYHSDPSKFEEYKIWRENGARAYFRSKMDVVGSWLDNGMTPIYGGSLPQAEDSLPANITWIIRWENKDQRDKVWAEVQADPELKAIFATVPGGMESYLRTEVRFATEA